MDFGTYKKWQTENQFWSSTNTRFTPFSEFKKKVESYSDIAKVSALGKSEKGKNIYQLILGEGSKRVMLWSQMHGNETTGTLVIFDVLDFLKSNKNLQTEIFENFTIFNHSCSSATTFWSFPQVFLKFGYSINFL